jgi:hypothetical protein
MTTPSQPDDDLKVAPEVIQDLDVTGDDADGIVGGLVKPGASGGVFCKAKALAAGAGG